MTGWTPERGKYLRKNNFRQVGIEPTTFTGYSQTQNYCATMASNFFSLYLSTKQNETKEALIKRPSLIKYSMNQQIDVTCLIGIVCKSYPIHITNIAHNQLLYYFLVETKKTLFSGLLSLNNIQTDIYIIAT